jgi:hypothetical protein
MRLFVWMSIVVAAMAGAPEADAGGKVSKSCTLKGKKLGGKFRVVKIGEDFKVRVVNIGEDLKVRTVNIGEGACGKWREVTIGENFKVRFVNIGEDFKIRYVNIAEGVP